MGTEAETDLLSSSSSSLAGGDTGGRAEARQQGCCTGHGGRGRTVPLAVSCPQPVTHPQGEPVDVDLAAHLEREEHRHEAAGGHAAAEVRVAEDLLQHHPERGAKRETQGTGVRRLRRRKGCLGMQQQQQQQPRNLVELSAPVGERTCRCGGRGANYIPGSHDELGAARDHLGGGEQDPLVPVPAFGKHGPELIDGPAGKRHEGKGGGGGSCSAFRSSSCS